MSDKRIGLVLAGGGGKGSYQAGCLQGLHDSGITRFHVICGSSVGSLNGTAAATGKIPELQELWRKITIASVLHLSWRLPFYVLGESVAWFLLLQRTIFGCAIDLIFVIVAAIVFTQAFSRGFWMILLAGLLLLIILTQVKLLWLIGGLGHVLRRVVETSFSLATNSALSRTIEQFFFSGRESLRLDCPMFATVARDGFWFDPDFPTFSWRVGLGGGDTDFHFDIEQPLPAHGWLPEYVEITSFSKKDLIQTLLQSACLPHAFRRMPLSDGFVIDGGVVDNIPLNKCLEFNCDLILVLHLDARPDGPQELLDRVLRLRRAFRCESADQAELHQKYLAWLREHAFEDPSDHRLQWRYFHDWDLPVTHDHVIVPLEPFDSLPPIVHVVPRKYLGGLLTGTLNFSKSKARRLLREGRNDTIETLRGAGII